ncbi:MAG TPA: hypothetical protein VK843_23045 [Planctomycetota bacterium]|nr:hypothetical protein [Planctomycetota bacterium]
MTPRLRLIFLLVAAVSCASALVFALLRYATTAGDEFSAYNHPAQPWALDFHIVSSVGLTLVLGFLLGVHALPRLATRSASRRSGIGLIVLAGAMISSGALLPCSSDTLARAALAWTHGISGALFALLVPWHMQRAGRARHGAALQGRG